LIGTVQAIEKLSAERIFKKLYVFANRRLGDAQFLCRNSETAVSSDRLNATSAFIDGIIRRYPLCCRVFNG